MNLLKKIFKSNSLKGINKISLTNEINQNRGLGITEKKRDVKLIVSVTSFPQRMHDIHYCLYSLLNQTFKPDELVLWLAEEQFPNLEKDLPKAVIDLKEKGLNIKWTTNIFSYKKLIPSLNEYQEAVIVTADDDIYYEKKWLEKLYTEYQQTPESITCHRAHRLVLDKNNEIIPYKKWPKKIKGVSTSFKNFFTGAGGVLYPPNCLYQDINNIELFTELAPQADDIWFWAMAILNNTKINIVPNNITDLTYVNPERERGLTGELTLFASNKLGGNDIQLQKVIAKYPQILEILKNE